MNLLTHRSELARVAPFVVQAGPLAPFQVLRRTNFPPLVVATVGSSLPCRGAHVAFNVESEVLWI
jgi:hypothetical protein